MASELQQYAVKVSPLVKKQLREIYIYICEKLKSPLAAKHLNYDIRNKITSLQELPNYGIQIQTEPWKSKGMRFVPVNNYDIYYVVKKATVYVFAVLYSRRDKNDLFNGLSLTTNGKICYSGNAVCEPKSEYGFNKNNLNEKH